MFIQKNGSASGPELAEHLRISSQAVHQHLRHLIAAGDIFKTGSTRAARYFPATAVGAARRFKRDLELTCLDEAAVYAEINIALNLSRLPHNVEAIVHYAFTEMLNNAVDHSKSDRCTIEVGVDAAGLRFSVRDWGIGAFFSIADKLDLRDEHVAMIELIKGKTTTMPDAHSGEGIFFVSRSADRMELRSHGMQIEWDQDRGDVFVSDPRYTKGTLVQFEIRRSSRRRLEDVFAEYAPEEFDFQFSKTSVLVKLLQSSYVSRSEAKRLSNNLEKFSEVELDMRDVQKVGQGFADEIFRVFAAAHPDTTIRTTHASPAVAAMLRHVRKAGTPA